MLFSRNVGKKLLFCVEHNQEDSNFVCIFYI